MSRGLAALGIGATAALVSAILALLVATLSFGTDRAVFGALIVALGAGAITTVVSWWILGARARSPVDRESAARR